MWIYYSQEQREGGAELYAQLLLMGGLKDLQKKKEKLIEKIRVISETSDGVENVDNARKLTELVDRRAELLSKKEKIEGEIAIVNENLGNVNQAIEALADSGMKRILEAIKKQRWYYFANKPDVIMDRDTALLWADLKTYPYGEKTGHKIGKTGLPYKSEYKLDKSIKIWQKNSDWAGYSGWCIPNLVELLKAVGDGTFPFCFLDPDDEITYEYEMYIKECTDDLFFVYDIMKIRSWAISYYLDTNIGSFEISSAEITMNPRSYSSKCCILPCYRGLVPYGYEQKISKENTSYSETEKLQMTLDVFIKNDLIPIFDNQEINELYKKVIIEKNDLSKQLTDINGKIKELENEKENALPTIFDYRSILSKYDIEAVDKSGISYSDAVLSATDEILGYLQEYEAAQADTIGELSQIALKLESKYVVNPHLTKEENEFLENRQRMLAHLLTLGTYEVKEQILSVRHQAEELGKRINEAVCGQKSIQQLQEIEKEPRASFSFLIESIGHIVNEAQKKVNFFIENRSFVTGVVKEWEKWSEDYKVFKTSMKEELAATCRGEGIDDDVYQQWYDDWQKKRFIIEQRFFPLIEFSLKGNLLRNDGRTLAIEKVLEALEKYKDSIDKFYLNDRKHIYNEFALEKWGDLQEKIKTESELYKLIEKLQSELSDILFSLEKTEERLFLLRWSEAILNIPIDEIASFVKERELVAISADVLAQFVALKKQNFQTYIADSKAYGEAMKQRESEFNALMVRMWKGLQKQ